jgi:hypothetical protein
MDEFSKQCDILGNKIIDLLKEYPKEVSICTIPGVLAVISTEFKIPQEVMIKMFQAALEDLKD